MTDVDRFDIAITPGPVAYVPPPGGLERGGGECVFLGRTRREEDPDRGPLERLTYAAYEAMALKEMRRLAEQVAVDSGALFVRMHHAVGDVPVGEASVFVQVVCGHRAEAFAACRELIDRLKREVPIWKRERWADGDTWSEGAPVELRKEPGSS